MADINLPQVHLDQPYSRHQMLKPQTNNNPIKLSNSSMNAMIKFIEQGHSEADKSDNLVELSFQRDLAAISYQQTNLSDKIQQNLKNMAETDIKSAQIEEQANYTSEQPSSSEDQRQIVKKQIKFHYGDRESIIEQEKSDVPSKDHSEQLQPMVEDSPLVIKQVPKFKPHKNVRKTNKCLVCKSSGRKVEMKKCYCCHLYVHLVCLQGEQPAAKSHYICQRCQFLQMQKNSKIQVVDLETEYQPALQKKHRINIQKLLGSQRRLNKFDKRSQQLCQFQQKYPNLIDGENILYPIDDRLLILYSELTQVQEKRRIEPSEHPIVPTYWLGDLLQIQNWLITFRGIITKHFTSITLPYLDTKQYLFTSMKQEGQDPAFKNILCTILRLFLSDILQNSRKQNTRMISENHFFQLLIELNQHGHITDQFLLASQPELFKNIAAVPSFVSTFRNITVPQTYDCASKISTIIRLLKAVNQTNSFRMLATRKTESIQQLVELKGKLIAKIKTVEAGRLQNKQKINDCEISQQSQKELKKDVKVKAKKKLIQLRKEDSSSQVQLEKSKQQLQECLRSLHFATTQIIFLGCDRNGSEYFFPRYQPFRVYVRYRRYFLDFDAEYGVYENQNQILQVARTLSSKGTNQKRLIHNIHVLNKLKLFQDKHTQVSPIIPEDHLHVHNCIVDLAVVLDFLRQIQTSYSQFLGQRGYEWGTRQFRANKLNNMYTQHNLAKLSLQINSLQEYFQVVQHFQSQLNGQRPKKKIQMRIWSTVPDKIKHYWMEYLLEQKTASSIWVALYFLSIHLNKFINRKIQNQSQQRKRKNKKNQQNQQQLNNKQSFQPSKLQDHNNLCSQDNSNHHQDTQNNKQSKIFNQKTKYDQDIGLYSHTQKNQAQELNVKIQKKTPKYHKPRPLVNLNKIAVLNQSQSKIQNQIQGNKLKKAKKKSKKLIKQIQHSPLNRTNDSFKSQNQAQLQPLIKQNQQQQKRIQLKASSIMQSQQQYQIVQPVFKKQQKQCVSCGNRQQYKKLVQCEHCKKYYDLKCSGLSRRPRNEWICQWCTQTNNKLAGTSINS